jgi:hypothetical protein
MERQLRWHLASSLIRKTVFVWTCAAFLAALALTTVPRWHELIHADANSPQHECAVTLIRSGNYHKPSPAPLVAAPVPAYHSALIEALHPVWVASPFVSARIFEHAPPAIAQA